MSYYVVNHDTWLSYKLSSYRIESAIDLCPMWLLSSESFKNYCYNWYFRYFRIIYDISYTYLNLNLILVNNRKSDIWMVIEGSLKITLVKICES